METIDYAFIWFIITFGLLAGYAILDGFDIGVGIFHLFSKGDRERRIVLDSIGPVWDGNEVWLVTAGGALFAGFPHAYATLCSGFYIPLMFFLFSLILRAVAIEFRSKQPMHWWRNGWDIIFSGSSHFLAFGLGLVAGNLIRGIPLDRDGEYIGHLGDLLHPYPILVGLMTTSLFAMHGAIYVMMKTEGKLHDKLRERVNPAIIVFIMFYSATTMATLIYMPHMTDALRERPFFFLVGLVNMLAIANIPREINHGRDGLAFLSSAISIAALMALFAVGTFPNLIRAINDPANSLTVYNSASSEKTLGILLMITAIGMPMVASYTISIYWIFRGKVKLDAASY